MATFRLGPLGYEVLVVNFVLTFAPLRLCVGFWPSLVAPVPSLWPCCENI